MPKTLDCVRFSLILSTIAPVAQWIEHWIPNPCAQVDSCRGHHLHEWPYLPCRKSDTCRQSIIGTRKPELLAPAGNFEKLEIAIHYGADAVYLAGKDFSLRNYSGNFTEEQLVSGILLMRTMSKSMWPATSTLAMKKPKGSAVSLPPSAV